MVVTEDMLSHYCKELRTKMKLGKSETKKLVPNLCDKERYVVHIINLQFYLYMGMTLKKVHRVLQFHQSAFMKPYFEFNTKMRKKAKSAFEKDLFKLMNNSVYGQTIENVRRCKNIELLTSIPKDRRRFLKLMKDPLVVNVHRFADNLVAVHRERPIVCLEKPVQIGFCVRDLSQRLMYHFHYGYIMANYGTQARLMFTETDSLLYTVNMGDIYKDMLADAEHVDFSDYAKDHPNFSEVHKKVLGNMKDETAERPVDEFVGLKAKMHSVLCGDEEKKRAKEVNKYVVKKFITHGDYAKVLNNSTNMYHQMNMFRNKYHNIAEDKTEDNARALLHLRMA